MEIKIHLESIDSIILSSLLTEMVKVAGKAGANYGKAQDTDISISVEGARKYWLNVTTQLHGLVDDLAVACENDDTWFMHTLHADFFSQEFLLKELAAMAQRIGSEAWKQFDPSIRDSILKRTSFVVHELRQQVAGVEQLKMFKDDDSGDVAIRVMALEEN
jgi:hypothetical protein